MSEPMCEYGSKIAVTDFPVRVKVKKLREDAILPCKATPQSAAYDVAVPEDTVLRPGRQVIPLGLAIELPRGYEAKIEPRSGYSLKGFAITSSAIVGEDGKAIVKEYEYRADADVLVGKIDADYRGEIGVLVKSNEPIPCDRIKRGQCIAQMTIYKVETAEFELTDTLSDTERGEGGFGHSGI